MVLSFLSLAFFTAQVATHDSESRHVRLDYPPAWSVSEDVAGVTFESPGGAAIRLRWETAPSRDDFLNERRAPNRQCSTRTNRNGAKAVVCVETASFRYTARVAVSMEGGDCLFSLSARGAANGPVLEAILDSARPISATATTAK